MINKLRKLIAKKNGTRYYYKYFILKWISSISIIILEKSFLILGKLSTIILAILLQQFNLKSIELPYQKKTILRTLQQDLVSKKNKG
ncbi:unnamed protein product [Paramecium octaurelia]|uniref:Transmembrane protein n=1 Tax=Paramecium octaurelia TaxID=43137 RepID=A0A8S1YHL9_PAROT|nr:unnamed protein product [Paramecium octaurelia]